MKRVLKWIGIVLGSVMGIVLIAGVVLHVVGKSRLNNAPEVATKPVTVMMDETAVARGEHLVNVISQCRGCHGDQLEGNVFLDGEIGIYLPAPNLTAGKGGIGATYSDEEIARVIWYGVKPDGSPTVGMPAEFHQAIHISDMEKSIAYLRSLPPVDTDYPPSTYGLMLRVMHAANQFPLIPAEKVDASQPPLDPISPDDTLAYGEYLSAICAHCHMADFAGDSEMFQSPNITPAAIGTWTEAEFLQAITEGVRPDGTLLDAKEMPWKTFSRYTDEELKALWAYLQTVEPVALEE